MRTPFRCLALLLIALTAGCTETGIRPTGTVSASDTADQILEQAELAVTNLGVRRSNIFADTAYFYESSQLAELRRVKVVFYSAEGAETSTLTSTGGTYNWRDGSMEARGNVLVASPEGRQLRTEVLHYHSGESRISTDRPFTYDAPGEHLEGRSFISDPDFRNVVTQRPRGTTSDGLVIPGQ